MKSWRSDLVRFGPISQTAVKSEITRDEILAGQFSIWLDATAGNVGILISHDFVSVSGLAVRFGPIWSDLV